MSIKQYPGGIITKNPTAPTTSAAKGIWTLDQAQNYTKQGIWPRSPGAPTIGTATDATGGAVSVTFSAPSCTGSNAITGYTATSTPGSVTGTAASSPITVSGLTNGTAYTFKVKATNGAGTGPESAASNSATPTAVVGQQAYTTAGTFSWTAPAGVTSVSVVAVGGGATLGRWPSSCSYANGGGGGALAYANNISVTPGNSYQVIVGIGGCCCSNGGCSSFNSTSVKAGGGKRNNTSNTGGAGGTVIAGTGGSGGTGGRDLGQANASPGGGGAGGYSGTGGTGANAFSLVGTAGTGGGGGGGVGYQPSGACAGGGGGVGLLGQGCSGARGSSAAQQGFGGSGGCGGGFTPNGAIYGGGSGRYVGAKGAVRIIWPGTTRSFPSTCTGDL